MSQETNISVINPEVSRADSWTHQDPVFFSARNPKSIRIGPKLTEGLDSPVACYHQADKPPWKARSLTDSAEAEASIAHLPVGQTVPSFSDIRLNHRLTGNEVTFRAKSLLGQGQRRRVSGDLNSWLGGNRSTGHWYPRIVQAVSAPNDRKQPQMIKPFQVNHPM